MKKIKTGLAVGATVVAVFAIGTGGAVAGSLVTSADIKDGTVRVKDMRPGCCQPVQQAGSGRSGRGTRRCRWGRTGSGCRARRVKGGSGLLNAFYATADYKNANAGAIATVACDSRPRPRLTSRAIAGGVQVLGLDSEASSLQHARQFVLSPGTDGLGPRTRPRRTASTAGSCSSVVSLVQSRTRIP